MFASMHRWIILAGFLAMAGPAVQAVPKSQGATYTNPVLSGFHADPSVCRMGKDDYYLATSSFEYFPGVPIYHSKDLVHWRQVGHALTRESQLPLAGQLSSKGIFAPTLRCHLGTLYLVTTNIDNGGSFFVSTRDPAGAWSEPVWIKEKSWSMDPSLFFDDDGKVYYTRHGGGRHGGVYQAEIDMATGALKEEPRLIWAGTGGIWPEGPHLYKFKGMYYLLISEGGTSYEHSLTMARSASPWGPFEAAPSNPLLTHRYHPELPLQSVGHADLVQTEQGNWWLVMLGVRHQQRHHHIGRETLLSPAAWDTQGWLVVNQARPLQTTMSAQGLPPAAPWPAEPVRDEFSAPRLGLQWAMLRGPAHDLVSLSERPGVLRLKASNVTLQDVATPAFVARRQEHLYMRAASLLDFTPTAEGQSAGLVLRQNEANHYVLRITGAPQRRVELVLRIAGQSVVLKSLPVGSGSVLLQVVSTPDQYVFGFVPEGGAMVSMGSLPTQALSSEKAGGFTGVFVGMYAQNETRANNAIAMPPADFAWFDYAPLGE
jgi:xylan 1,4-beta-xylosidase